LKKMPHLVEGDHDLIGGGGGLGKLAGFGANPVEDRDVADAEKAGDAAEAHVAHGVEQQRQGLHRRRLAPRRRRREIVAARAAAIALHPTHNPVLYMVRRAAALATNLRHGGLILLVPPMDCYQNG
jgi:hypothetical protein